MVIYRKLKNERAIFIKFPPLFDENKFFSSFFRISSNDLRLWTHFDVCLKNDVYGNKDLVNGSKAFLFADKAIKELNLLPNSTYKEFYTKRIIQSLLENLNSKPSEN